MMGGPCSLHIKPLPGVNPAVLGKVVNSKEMFQGYVVPNCNVIRAVTGFDRIASVTIIRRICPG